MRVVFWISLGLVLYVYAGYPLVLSLWARLRPRPSLRADGYRPAVSIVIAARDEAVRVPARLENLAALEYPADRLEIVLVSDGSTDPTAEAAAATADCLRRAGIAFQFIQVERNGKAEALNAGVSAARHDIVVFADARQLFAPDAVRRLVAPFADHTVGAVSGELVLDCETGISDSTVRDGVGAYWRYEKWLRARESDIDSMLGATGAIYALRRACWRPLPPGTILDDVLAPMRAVFDGWRVVFEPEARAFDVTAPNAAAEVQRKTRTLAGNYQLLLLEPRLLVPVLNRVWLQYMSHKVGRLLVPWALVSLFIASAALARSSTIYLVASLGQALFYALALYGARLERTSAEPANALPVPERAAGRTDLACRLRGHIRRHVARWRAREEGAR
jgi:cellulose synthase/poly-beta-1,6-N-acetylglucosamine synthase-like glycosyltransferase